MAVHEPPLGLPFVDQEFYVARPWIEWLILAQTNFADIEEDVDAIEVDTLQIAINTANIALNTANIATNIIDIATNASDIVDLQSATLTSEALSYYFASL